MEIGIWHQKQIIKMNKKQRLQLMYLNFRIQPFQFIQNKDELESKYTAKNSN